MESEAIIWVERAEEPLWMCRRQASAEKSSPWELGWPGPITSETS